MRVGIELRSIDSRTTVTSTTLRCDTDTPLFVVYLKNVALKCDMNGIYAKKKRSAVNKKGTTLGIMAGFNKKLHLTCTV